MSEFDKLMEHVKDKSNSTIKAYSIAYKKLRKLLEKDVEEASQKKIIEAVMEGTTNLNSAQALINIGVMIRKLNNLNVLELEHQRTKNTVALAQYVKEKNQLIGDTLPSYDELWQYTDSLYANAQYKEFIINYLLLKYQTRNEDLMFTVVKRKMDCTDLNKNYIWLRNRVATYFRREYKTANVYGEKIHKITNMKFITAIRRIIGLQNIDDDKAVFVPTESQLGYYIQKYTYKQLGETKYVKIVIDHFRGDIQKLREISENRGTDLSTLAQSYDIKNI